MVALSTNPTDPFIEGNCDMPTIEREKGDEVKETYKDINCY